MVPADAGERPGLRRWLETLSARPRDVAAALRWSWLLLTVAAAATVLAPFVAGEGALLGLAPACPSMARGSPCAACGLTRAFVHIARGELAEATRLNRFSLPLFTAFALNAAVALGVTVGRVASTWRRSSPRNRQPLARGAGPAKGGRTCRSWL